MAQLLREHPEAKPLIRRLIVMGGALEIGYDGRPPAVAEWNIKQDIAAAKAVFSAGLPLTLVPLDATAGVKLSAEQERQLFAAGTPLAFQLANLVELCEQPDQSLFDAVALAAAFDERLFTFGERRLSIAHDGRTVTSEDGALIRAATSLKRDEFLAGCLARLLAHGDAAWPAAPGNRSQLVELGAFPSRVHVVEDYETDIERRWWLCGRLETEDLPPGSRRACRAVLTQDFDDRQGDRRTSYRAVVFNPVPGPPMGASTRLAFRYKLRGTDTLRVQLFSLSNGYHRYLSLAGLPQDEWRTAAVDLTQMRRPDGSGGPLAADERIDDIQFYIDPRAELLIDDVILFGAAPADEKRPFPKRILFAGWFDTGKQGQEWPGEFEIVPHEKPRTWKFARSIAAADGSGKLRVNLRGPRQLPQTLALTFDYRLTGADSLRVELGDGRGGQPYVKEVAGLKRDAWSRATVDFAIRAADGKDAFATDVQFSVPAGAVLEIDNLLLYERGE
jgi:hypothetical protein